MPTLPVVAHEENEAEVADVEATLQHTDLKGVQLVAPLDGGEGAFSVSARQQQK